MLYMHTSYEYAFNATHHKTDSFFYIAAKVKNSFPTTLPEILKYYFAVVILKCFCQSSIVLVLLNENFLKYSRFKAC
jgi:hypothetical protein